MKKIKITVAALLIAGSSYSQSPKDSVKISKADLEMIIIDLDDILSWQYEDMHQGLTYMGSYEEEWGSNYWLTLMRNKLASIYNEVDCENCDEID